MESDMLTRFGRDNKKGLSFAAFFCLIGIFLLNIGFASAQNDSYSIFRNRIYLLKHITAEDSKLFLSHLKIGTDIKVLPDNSLLLTSDKPADLTKASSLLGLIDSAQPFGMKTIFSMPDFETLPKIEEIESKLGYLSIGTFKEPPADKSKPMAIIDMHQSDLVVIGPQEYLDTIIKTVSRMQELSPAEQENSLRRELEETKKQLAELKKTIAETPEDTRETENIISPEDSAVDLVEEEDLPDLGQRLYEKLLEAEQIVSTRKKADSLIAQAVPATPVTADPAEMQIPPIPDVTEEKVQPQPEEKLPAPQREDKKIQTKSPAPAKNFLQPEIAEAEKELELTLSLPEKVEIITLLELVGKQLGLNYIYDAKKIKGEIMLKIHDGKIKVKDTYALLESALKFRGFVMTRRGNLVTIIPTAEALNYDPVLRFSTDQIRPGDVIVTSIFHLDHVSTESAQNLLKNMKLGLSYNSIPETGTLIVTGYAYRMGRIERLLKMIDVAGEPQQIRYRQLQYTLATDIAPKVKTLAEQVGTISITVSASTKAAPAPKKSSRSRKKPAPKKPTPSKAQALQKSVYLDTDERTNRIIMIGTTADLDIVDGFIDILDIERPDLRVIKEYEIQYVDPTAITNTLVELGVIQNAPASSRSSRRRSTTRSKTAKPTTPASASQGPANLLDEPLISVLEATNSLLINATQQQHTAIARVIAHVDRQLERASTPFVVYQLENQDPEELAGVLNQLIEKTTKDAAKSKDPKIQTRAEKTGEQQDITIVPDISTYSLIVYADRKNQQWIKALIEELDQYRPQVLLDVTLVEITKQDDFNYDLNILNSIPDLDFTSGRVVNPLIPSGSILDALMNAPDRSRFIDFGSDSGNFSGFYGNKKIMALFTAMQTKKYGRILAKPKLLVDDNQEGSIETKKTTYITRQTTIIQQTQGSDPITSTDVKFDPYDASIKLTIRPHISKGDNLRLEIALSRSDFLGLDPTSLKPPDRADTNVETVITVPDGSTIILGGMDKIDQGKGGTKIPILGDIPFIGGLFRSTSNVSTQSKLYIFIKAHILRPGTTLASADIINISRKNRADFESIENEMQKYENWPGFDPEPMDPLKILEDDEPLK